ncbi:MAG: hypothetical protein PHZ19_09655 [Candidatus Thermoplasmatota archaeon]|nr:hypothetical protein [Candidatus Thermoplasmatota archaeon]
MKAEGAEKVKEMQDIVRKLIGETCRPDSKENWVLPILSELSIVLSEISSCLVWCEECLERVRKGYFQESGVLQGNAVLLDISVGEAAVLINLLPEPFRKQLDSWNGGL